MPFDRGPAPLQIAVTAGALTPPLATLLARQRAEEPETPVRLVETTVADQCWGLEEGRYCLGFSTTPDLLRHPLQSAALWQDELAVAVPPRSPLLALAEIPLHEAVQHPLILWHREDHEAPSPQIESLLASVDMELRSCSGWPPSI